MDEAKKMIKGIFRSQRISSCVFSSDDFKKLYHLLSEKAEEAAQIVLQEWKEKEKTLSLEDRNFFKQRMPDALRLVAYVTGTKGERVIFTEKSEVSSETIPESIETIGIGSAFAYNVVFQADPSNKFDVRLDFTKPRLLDFSNPWSLPSESKNYIQVEGNNETWVNGVYQSIISFFQSMVKRRGWLHARHTYDLFLWLLGVPVILLTIFRLDGFVRQAMLPLSSVLVVAIYLYVFFMGLFLFRLLFNYARWLFPRYEYRTKEDTKPAKHRYVLGMFLLAIVTYYVQDLLRYLFKHLF